MTTAALSLLRESPDPSNPLAAFTATYGDFYVSSLSVGGDAGVCLTMDSTSHDDEEDKHVVVKVKFLFWSKNVTIADSHEMHSLMQRRAGLVAHDTLQDEFVERSWPNGIQEVGEVGEVRQYVANFVDKVERLDARVAERMEKWKDELFWDKKVEWDVCKRAWADGLVVEMVLVPFTGLREVQSALLAVRSR